MSSDHEIWLERYLEDMRKKGKSFGTVANNRKYVTAFLRYIDASTESTRCDLEATDSDVRAFATHLLNQRYTSKTAASMIGGVLQWARWLSENHVENILRCGDATAISIVEQAVSARKI